MIITYMSYISFIGKTVYVISISVAILFFSELSNAKNTEIFNFNIKELMNVKVETPNRIEEKLIKSDSAIFIITSEDIKNSGYTTLPDVLKIVPGVDVVRVDSSKWGVAIRGFNGVFVNKLMILIDGVNIYNHLFSGVFWDIQSIPLDMIQRIEIIRGASGTMWGANAVNGVINIITKKVSNMEGFSFMSAYGKNTDDSFNLLYGKKINEYLDFAIDANYQDFYKVKDKTIREEPVYLKGVIKVEYEKGKNRIVFFTHMTSAKMKNNAVIPQIINGNPEMSEVKGRYNFDYQLYSFALYHNFSNVNNSILRLNYINSDISSFYENPKKYDHSHINTRSFTVDYQENFKYSKHNFVWGGMWRLDRDSTNRTDFTFDGKLKKYYHMYNIFLSDKISFSKKINISLGSKYEYNNSISKSALLSTLKFSYYFNENSTLWFSFSNSVRTPSNLDTDSIVPIVKIENFNIVNTTEKIVVKSTTSSGVGYEKLFSFEMGLKKLISENFYIDFAMFFNRYKNLEVMEKGVIYAKDNYYVLPFYFSNRMEGDVYGFEIWGKIKPMHGVILSPFYSYCYIKLNDHNSLGNEDEFYKKTFPTYKFGSKIILDISRKIKLNSFIFYKDSIPYYNIDGYWGMDLSLSTKITENISISILGNDLFENRHREFSNEFLDENGKSVGRSICLKFNLSY